MATADHIRFCGDLHEHVQQHAPDFLGPNDEQEEGEGAEPTPESGVLTGWYLVCAWRGTDGNSWATYHRRPDQAIWESQGLLYTALQDL
jgi:hypothetical protein